MQKQVLEFPVVAARTDSCQTVHDDFDAGVLGSLHHGVECRLSTEHLAWCLSRGDCKGRCIRFLVLLLGHLLLEEALVGISRHWCIVSLEYSHKIQGRHPRLFVTIDGSFDIGEVASPGECLVLVVDLCILIVNLDLMEYLLAHTLGMHDESPLSQRSVNIIRIVILIGTRHSPSQIHGKR